MKKNIQVVHGGLVTIKFQQAFSLTLSLGGTVNKILTCNINQGKRNARCNALLQNCPGLPH